MKTFDITVFGDINLDSHTAANLDFAWTDLDQNGRTVLAEVRDEPGGSGLNFARFAMQGGRKVNLVGVVGDDYAGRSIIESLRGEGMDNQVRVAAGLSTGRCLIARDSSDIRLLINTALNANHDLGMDDLEQAAEALRDSRVVYVSGFCVRNRTDRRSRTCIRLMQMIAELPSPPVLVFDVVPHRIYETYPVDEFLEITRHAGLLVSEVATLRRFFGLGDRHEKVGLEEVEATLEAASRHFPRLVLRYGPSGCDEELLWDGTRGLRRHCHTGHDACLDKRGFGDRLMVRHMAEFFALFEGSSA